LTNVNAGGTYVLTLVAGLDERFGAGAHMAEQKKKSEPRTKPFRFDLLIYAALLLVVTWSGHAIWSSATQEDPIPYSKFQDLIDKRAVTDLVISDTMITGSYLKTKGEDRPRQFSTVRVDPQIAEELRKRHISYSGRAQPGVIWNIIGWLAPIAGLALMWSLMLRPMGSGLGSAFSAVGLSKAKVFAEKGISVTFADVAGVDEAKQELAEVVGFLKNPNFYGRLGARVPKGVLLVGPPGTGKTLLARAVAGEAGVPFFSITGSEFVEMFVGVGAARVRDLFKQARENTPSIIFIDELDALGRARGIDIPGAGHDEKEQTLNQLLAEMDGFDPSTGCIVLAATNRPEILDQALLRAGRFDRQVLVDRPDRKGRIDILRVHLKKISAALNLDIDAIAALTPGFTGADLANLVNEAALVATRRGGEATMLEDFSQAIERIVAGLEKKSRILSVHEREVVAHHEMGHALVAMSLPGTDPVQKVSIIPRGLGALGYTLQRPTEDRFIMRGSELSNRLAVLMGGRAAEAIIFGDISTGAADDIARATEIARDMVVRFGMTSELGQVAYEPERGSFLNGHVPVFRPRQYGDRAADEIDQAVKTLVETAFLRARDILTLNRTVLEDGAQELLAHETLGSPTLDKLARQLNGPEHRKPSLTAVP
jgi:cell division protease FtsH